MRRESKKMEISGMKINYTTRGSGKSALLLLHGAVGSYEDFYLQLDEQEGLNGDELTIVAPDLPGCGGSELVGEELDSCEPCLEYFELCAQVCGQLMSKLGFKTYSIGGWDDGARVGALMAISFQSRCNALILWGFAPKMDKEWSLATARVRDTGSWEPEVLQNYTNVYGEQTFSEMWRKYVDFVVKALELPETFDISSRLSKIKCPTLVLHGSHDPIISWSSHVQPIEMQIYDSHLKQFPKLAHNLHQADPARFNPLIEQFVATGSAGA